MMYGAVLPTYGGRGDGNTGKKETVIKADDPRNREMVRKFLDEIED